MIRILSDKVVDRIAAGEVVERPAAVVKELVENALDAGASRVTIQLEGGGRRLIRVVDDGEGIAKEDLERVFLRHATSKLSEVEDLFHIASLGFRGEALASIGAVSRARILSRRRDAAEGGLVENEGGRTGKPRPAGCPPGTSVEVKNLFYNVPPRLKFLKTEATELSHCVEAVTRFALSFPELEFVLEHNGRQVLRAEKNAGLLERIASFFGGETADALLPIDRDELGISVKGFLGKPDIGRKDMRRSYLFLNGRYVKDRAVHAALRRAYKEVMPEKFHPVYFLQLGMPPDWVDVNVHPTKIEVRFLDGARVFSAVHKAAADTLAGGERFDAAALTEGRIFTGWRPRKAPGGYPATGKDSFTRAGETEVAEDSLGFDTTGGAAAEAPSHLFEPSLFPGESAGLPSGGILQVHDTYAVFETPSGVGIVDQHALHERMLYEKLKQEYEAGGIRLQKLLMPVTIELEPSRASRAGEICFDLNHLGIRAEPSGRSAIRVTAIPALLKDADPHGLVTEVIDRVAEGDMGEEAYRGLLHRLACRAAVKAGKRLSEDELRALLEGAEGMDFSGRCPHGRPTLVVISLKDLEEMFKRRGF